MTYVDCTGVTCVQAAGDCVCLSLVSKHQLQSLLCYLLSDDEFLSSYGIRSLSKVSMLSYIYFHFVSLQFTQA